MSCTAGTVTRRDALEIVVVSAGERSAVVVMRNHSEEGAAAAAAAVVVAVGQDCVTIRSDHRAEEEGRGQ